MLPYVCICVVIYLCMIRSGTTILCMMVDISEVVFLVCMRKRCFHQALMASFCSALVAGPYVALLLKYLSKFDNGVLLDESTGYLVIQKGKNIVKQAITRYKQLLQFNLYIGN